MTRREWIALHAMTIAGACGRKKGTGFDGYALIATAGDESLGVVDLTAFRLIKSIPLGARPTAVITGSGKGLVEGNSYVLTQSNGTIHKLNRELTRVLSKKVAGELSAIGVMPDGNRLVAIAGSSRELIEIEAGSLNTIRRHKLEGGPVAFDVAADQHVAISTGERGVIQMFNLETGANSRAQVPGPLGDVRFRRDAAILLAANLRDRSIAALEVPSLQSVADLPLAMQPENLCFNSDGGQLFVSGAGMDGVGIVFPYTLEVDETLLAGRSPGAMACSEKPPYLFVGSRNASDVCIFDIGTRRMIGIVEVGEIPGRMAITPDNQYALALSEKSGNMAVIHIAAIRGNKWKSGAALFTMIPVGDRPVDAAIVPRRA
ncbi:MAG: hypothetical protein JOY53_18680 [Acidobacteriaceae bacterium]|nr:hypothetical protein [Acidobacteriaceae bacterium]